MNTETIDLEYAAAVQRNRDWLRGRIELALADPFWDPKPRIVFAPRPQPKPPVTPPPSSHCKRYGKIGKIGRPRLGKDVMSKAERDRRYHAKKKAAIA